MAQSILYKQGCFFSTNNKNKIQLNIEFINDKFTCFIPSLNTINDDNDSGSFKIEETFPYVLEFI